MTNRVFDASWQRPKVERAMIALGGVDAAGVYLGLEQTFDMARPEDRAAWHVYAASQLAAGDGIILYASRTDSKCPTPAECDAYRAKGVEVGFVFEDSATRAATGSHADGVADGQLTASMLKARGHAKGKPAYYACDTNDTLSLDYARGFAAGLAGYYEPRLYAGDRNLARAATVGQALGWQASAASWSDHWNSAAHHGAYPGVALYQVVGASPIPGTDLNVINDPAWNGGTPAPIPEDDMTPDEHATLTNCEALLKDVQTRLKSTRLTAIDQMAFNVNGGDDVAGLRAVIGGMRTDLMSVAQKVGVLTAAGSTDVTAVVDAIVDGLGDDLAKQVADLIAARLKS